MTDENKLSREERAELRAVQRRPDAERARVRQEWEARPAPEVPADD